MPTFLYGAYGTGNLGDDLLLKSALEQHGSDVIAVCYGAPLLREPPRWVDHDRFLAAPAEYLSPGDRLIFAGGGLFWAPTHADDMRNVAVAAKALGCDVSVERIGAQGVHCNIEAAREMMLQCDSITVRDQHSVDLLRSLEVTDRARAEPDFALILSNVPEPRPADRPLIGINHSATPFFSDPEHRSKALHCYGEVVNAYAGEVDFTYVPHTRHFRVMSQNDVVYGEYFWNATGGKVVNPPFPATVEDLLELYARLWGVVGWRYHLLATAVHLGLPAAFFGQMGGHKYGALAADHKLPQIDFDLPTAQIVPSLKRFMEIVKRSR